LLAELQEKVGAKVDIINFATYTAPADSAFTELHDQAISASRTVTSRLDSLDAYAAVVPWFVATGELIGLIDVQLDAAEFDAAARELARRLLFIALAILALAALGGIAYGKWLARPLEVLQGAANRIGRGDFSVAVRAEGVSEIHSLALTMDEMRHNLVDLTATLRRREAEAGCWTCNRPKSLVDFAAMCCALKRLTV
jgi:nitrate/nitrite-specific signal transduction histidine kinase